MNKHPPKSAPVPTPTQGESSTADHTSSKEPTRAPVAEPPPDSDTFSDFGFSSSGTSSSDELGSKINDLVAMVKSKVKKKKKKKRKQSEQDSMDDDTMTSEPIPKLKIRFGKQRSGSEEVSSCEETKPSTDSPMKLTIKLGNVGSSPLLPPPPLLTLHKPSPPVMSPQPSSPKYEPAPQDENSTVLKFKVSDVEECEEKPPIKLTLRVAQPMRNVKGWISPRTEQLVNYIDNVTTFIDESVEFSGKSENAPECSSPEHAPLVTPPTQAPAFPEPPKLKLAPTSPSKRVVNCKPAPLTTKIMFPAVGVCRKRKRESSPKHHAAALTPKEVIEEVIKPAVPPLKFRKSCLSNKVVEQPSAPDIVPIKKSRAPSASSSDTPITKGPKMKKRKNMGSVVENKEFWNCGIFSNTLKQDSRKLVHDELDFRSNILPIYCGKMLKSAVCIILSSQRSNIEET